MGLDTSHDCWHGPHSAFSRWRNEVAQAGGFKLTEQPFIGTVTHLQPDVDWTAYQGKNFHGEWDVPPSDPLLYLLVHSDCEGVIHPQHAALLADRLQEIVDKLPARADYDSIKPATERFIAGLRKAVAANEDVEFH